MLFRSSGMSAEEMTKRIGATSASFKKSGFDQGLMKLGFDFQKQSDIMADVIGTMGESAAMGGGRKATQSETERATLQMAKSMSMIAAVTGEDYETRKKAAAEEAKILSNQIDNAKLVNKFGPEYAASIKSTTEAMSPAMTQAMREMQASGGKLTSAAQNQMAQASPAYKKMMDELYQARMRGELKSAEDVYKIEGKYREQVNKDLMKQSAYANAATTGAQGVIQEGNKMMAGEFERGARVTKDKIKAAGDNIANATEPPKPGEKPKDPLGDAIVGAAVTMNNFQKDMEKYVVNNLPAWSNALQESIKTMKDAYQGKVAGLNPLADKFKWLTDFMQKYGLMVQLAVLRSEEHTSELQSH